MHGKLSLRASVTSELVLDGVEVPEANRLPEATSLRAPLSCLNEARYGIVWGAAGAARACYEAALDYAKTRVQFDKPIAGYQLTQAKLVEMAVKVGAVDDARDAPRAPEGRGHAAHRAGLLRQVPQRARGDGGRAHGAARCSAPTAITLEYPVLRHANNLESVLTYEGTHEMHTLILGQAITGLAAFTTGAAASGRDRVVARDLTGHDQRLDAVGALEGEDRLHVGVLAGDVVLEQDPVAAEDVARHADDLARLGGVVHLRQRRHAGGQAAVVGAALRAAGRAAASR